MDLSVQSQPDLQHEFQDSQGYTKKPCLGWGGVKVSKSQRNGPPDQRGHEKEVDSLTVEVRGDWSCIYPVLLLEHSS